MNKDSDKTKEQLLVELAALRQKSKNQEDKLKAVNQQLEAQIQQIHATEQQLRAANQQLNANNQQLIANEQELKKEKIFSEKIVETADAIIVGLDKDHIIRIFNRGAEQITTYKKEEVIGKDWFKIFFPKEMLDEMNKVWKDAWGVKSYSYINLILAKFGEGKIISWQTTGMYDSDDVSKHLMLSIGEDITERKQAEEMLKEREEKYRIIFESAKDAIFIMQEDRFIDCNEKTLEMFGCNREDIIGEFPYDFSPEKQPDGRSSREKSIEKINKALAGEPQVFEWVHITKDGKLFHTLVTLNRYMINDEKFLMAIVRDITERKQAEEKLKESEEKYRKIFENVQDIFYQIDTEGNIIEISPSVKRYSGYSREELIGTPVEHRYYNPNDRAILKAELEKKGEIADYEIRMKTKSDRLVYASLNAHILYDENKKPAGIEGSLRDITERKQAEEKLKESEETYRNLFHNAQVGLFRTRIEDGMILESNEQLANMFGYKNRNELINEYKTSENYVDPGTREKMLEIITEKGEINNYEARFYRKDGSIFWANYSAKVYPEKGWIEGVAEDITERKRTEEVLRESEGKFRKVFTTSPDSININRLEDGMYISINDGFTKITGYSESDVIGKTSLEINIWVNPGDREKLVEGLRKHSHVQNLEAQFRMKDGKVVYGLMSATVITLDGVPHIISITKDVTERKQAEEDLKIAKEKAEESDRLKSAFLANMSHEIRTPMNAILGFTELLKEPQLIGDEKDEYVRIIEKSGNRLLNTINDIIDISRIEAGQVKVTKTEVSVNEILEEQYSFFYHEAESKGIELNYKKNLSDREARLITDKQKLEGILTNLIKNAIKFTETGSITFGYDIVTVEDKAYFEFYVKDTGIGIPADKLDAVFNRFEQADMEDTRVFEGSGLGLAISKSYVEMLGGKISVKSKEGEGSTFTFNMPYNKQNLKKSSITQNNEEKSGVFLKNLSIIVAEDDETNKLFYKKIFKNKFKKTTYTTTGKETIEKFRENPDTNIILMDIKMSDMNGYDATREIRKFNSDVVIIAQTAFGLAGDREKAIEAGCNDYIAKPIKKEILFIKIRACLDKKSI